MVIKSLKIKTKSNYDWDDIVYIYDVNAKLIKVIKRELKIGVDIYYIGYMFEPENKISTIKPFYLVISCLFGHIEKIEGSSDRYLAVNINNYKIINIFNKLWKFIENKITFGNKDNKIKEYNKLRFSSDIDLPLSELIDFCALTITISCVIKKVNKYYPEIYLDEALYVQNIK